MVVVLSLQMLRVRVSLPRSAARRVRRQASQLLERYLGGDVSRFGVATVLSLEFLACGVHVGICFTMLDCEKCALARVLGMRRAFRVDSLVYNHDFDSPDGEPPSLTEPPCLSRKSNPNGANLRFPR